MYCRDTLGFSFSHRTGLDTVHLAVGMFHLTVFCLIAGFCLSHVVCSQSLALAISPEFHEALPQALTPAFEERRVL